MGTGSSLHPKGNKMLLGRFGAGFGLAVVLPLAVWAGPIKDPQMGLDADSLSSPFTTGTTFAPNNGCGVFRFFNPFPQFIVGITIETRILPELTPQQLNGVFQCNDQFTTALPNPFFKNCAINYTFADGTLDIRFFGVNPDRGDDPFPETEAGEHEGIPPLRPGCTVATADSEGCNRIGHFLLTLNNGFSEEGNNGGWSTTATPGIFLEGGPTFKVTQVTLTPEPATAAMLFGALVCLGIAKRPRKRP